MNPVEQNSKKPVERTVGARNLLRNSSVLFAADGVLMFGRLLTFVLLGRAVGKESFGDYAAILATAQLFFAVSQWGLPHVLVRNYSRGQPFETEWAKTVTVTWSGAIIGTAGTIVVSQIFFDNVNVITVGLIAMAQLLGLALMTAASIAAAAKNQPLIGLSINGANTVFRLLAIAAFLYFGFDSIDIWAYFMFALMIATALLAVSAVSKFLDGSNRFCWPSRKNFRDGAGFVVVAAANSAQADIDKVVLKSADLSADAGVYAAGYRVPDLAMVPLKALVTASYAEFFKRSSDRIADGFKYAKQLTLVGAAYGIVAAGAMLLAAPIFGFIMGNDFEESVTVVRWLAFLPFIKAVQYFPANLLTGNDKQWTRAGIFSFTAVVNLAINLVLTPTMGWRGAAIGTMVAEGTFAFMLWFAAFRALRLERALEADQANKQSEPNTR